MRLQFKQALHLGGKDYGRGHHEVPDAVIAAHRKVIERFVNAGLILEGANVVEPVSAETLLQRQKRLAESLSSVGHKPSQAPEPESQSPSSEPKSEDDQPSLPLESEEESDSLKKKRSRR